MRYKSREKEGGRETQCDSDTDKTQHSHISICCQTDATSQKNTSKQKNVKSPELIVISLSLFITASVLAILYVFVFIQAQINCAWIVIPAADNEIILGKNKRTHQHKVRVLGE